MNDEYIELDSQSIFWDICLIPKDDEEDGKYAELQWGWTAGMSKEDLKNAAEDAPQGYSFVRILPAQARELRDKLNTWLHCLEDQERKINKIAQAYPDKPLHKITPEEQVDIEAWMSKNSELFKQFDANDGLPDS